LVIRGQAFLGPAELRLGGAEYCERTTPASGNPPPLGEIGGRRRVGIAPFGAGVACGIWSAGLAGGYTPTILIAKIGHVEAKHD